jgi:predicted acetyltransferase
VTLQEAQQPKPLLVSDHVSWGKYTFSREPFAEVSRDSLEFLENNYDETGQFQDVVPLDVDWDGMFYYESKGALYSFALRLDGKMIGYAIFLITPTLHAKSTMHAISDVIFIAKEYRQGLVGIKFIEFCEEHVKAAGVKVVHLVMKADPRLVRVLERSGHRVFEVTYMKVL